MASKPGIPANRPANAVGYIARHHRRTERFACYDLRTPDLRAGFFACEDTFESIRTQVELQGYTVTDDGFMIPKM